MVLCLFCSKHCIRNTCNKVWPSMTSDIFFFCWNCLTRFLKFYVCCMLMEVSFVLYLFACYTSCLVFFWKLLIWNQYFRVLIMYVQSVLFLEGTGIWKLKFADLEESPLNRQRVLTKFWNSGYEFQFFQLANSLITKMCKSFLSGYFCETYVTVWSYCSGPIIAVFPVLYLQWLHSRGKILKTGF